MHAHRVIVLSVMQSLLAANIRAELARKGKTQADLAELLGITQQGISRRMLGHVDFRLGEITKIADFLGVTVAALLSEAVAA